MKTISLFRKASMKHFKELFNLSILYVGKIGGILFTILFIPIYRKYLNPTQFGLISILISLQMITYVLDFSFSTDLSRMASWVLVHPAKRALFHRQFRIAKSFLETFYLVVFLSLSALFAFSVLDSIFPAVSSLLILSLTIFNLKTSLLLASQKYVESSLFQLGSSLGRGGLGALTVYFWPQNLTLLVMAQLSVMIMAHFLIEGSLRTCIFKKFPSKKKYLKLLEGSGILVRRCLPLLITAGVGAICTQADRFVILGFGTAADVGHYFLAATFALTPIVIVAQPLFQYFYPKIVEGYHSNTAEIRTSYFSAILVLAILISSTVLYFFAEQIIYVWLGSDIYGTIWPLASVLIISSILAAFSFAPYTLMLCEGRYSDFKIVTLYTIIGYGAFLGLAAYKKNLILVCFAFLIYNLVTILSQTYFCYTYDNCKKLNRIYMRHWAYFLPFLATLIWITISKIMLLKYVAKADTLLIVTAGYAAVRIILSLKDTMNEKNGAHGIDRCTDPQ